MDQELPLPPAKRKKLLAKYGNQPPGYTHEELETFLDLFYGLFSHIYTKLELRQMRITDPFDLSEKPRQLTVKEFAEWLEALL
jgi:hypothetical protein